MAEIQAFLELDTLPDCSVKEQGRGQDVTGQHLQAAARAACLTSLGAFWTTKKQPK